MSVSDDFLKLFGEDGRYQAGNGAVEVAFVTRGGKRYRGKLHFTNGLCVRAEMVGGGDWSYPDNTPLNEIRFLLDFGEAQPLTVLVDQGRIIAHSASQQRSTKGEFLSNFRVARNLFVHPRVEADSSAVDTQTAARTLARAAIWLTPRSVAGFNPADFPELGPDRTSDLQAAVRDFLDVARSVPPNEPATDDQYRRAAVAFERMLGILSPYLPVAEEAKRVEAALRRVEFPSWVVNWDFELGSDSDGAAAVWVNVFADEERAPSKQAGQFASDLTTRTRKALAASGVARWPYVRMRTAGEHKAQV